jgi:hypothetical protein
MLMWVRRELGASECGQADHDHWGTLMNMPKTRGVRLGVMVLAINLTFSLSGCGGNPNEAEFFKSAPPGVPSEFPNESVAQRKERTRAVPKQVKQIEERDQKIAAKKEQTR